MPQITGYLAELQLDTDSLLRELDVKFTEILVQGTKQWVETVKSIVPNWSGMSRASLQPLAELVGVTVFAAPVSRPWPVPNRVAEGRAAAVPAPRLVFGVAGQYFFEWRSQVFHLVYNENNNANLVGFRLRNPGPYNSMAQAESAFFASVNPALNKIDFNISGHIRVVRHQINTLG